MTADHCDVHDCDVDHFPVARMLLPLTVPALAALDRGVARMLKEHDRIGVLYTDGQHDPHVIYADPFRKEPR